MSYCYQHADRETYINCTRCGEFICPECMVSAPVGFQCAQCVQKTSAPKVKVSFSNSNKLPMATKYLLGLTVGAYLYGMLNGGILYMASNFGMVPIAIADGQWWRLLTAAFLHGGLLHLAFNMYALYWLGPQLEELLGRVKFTSIYLLAAIGGNVASYYFSQLNTVSVGASGAIFGLMTATIVIGRERRADVSQLVTLLALNVVLGFMNSGIDWRAHLGGAVVGALAANFQGKPKTQTLGLVGIGISLLVFVFLRNQQILSSFGL